MSAQRPLTPLSVRLKEGARQAGLSAEKLADSLDLSASTIRHWWTARSQPSFETLERYAALCGVSAYWLITGKPDQEDVVTRLYRMLEAFRAAVLGGDEPAAAWERILGRGDILTPEERGRLSSDPAGLRAYLASEDGMEWVTLTPEQHRIVGELLRLLGRYAKEPPPQPPAPAAEETT